MVGSALTLQNAAHEAIIPYCIFDRDYHSPEEVAARYREADERGVVLHVWERKEIENYLLVPAAIARAIVQGCRPGVQCPNARDVTAQLELIAEELRPQVELALGSEWQSKNRAEGFAGAMTYVRDRMVSNWNSLEGKLRLISGKEALSRLSTWSTKEFGVSLSPERIIYSMTAEDVPVEMRGVVRTIDASQKFPANLRV